MEEKSKGNLEDVSPTDQQLLQLEKMAALGSMAAGIIHEIKNPLNFVINWSVISKEVLEEMKGTISQLEQGEDRQELVESLQKNLEDLEGIIEKIEWQGQKAAHTISQVLTSAGVQEGSWEQVEFNLFLKQCLDFAYMGVRGENPSFHCELNTELDDDIGLVEVLKEGLYSAAFNIFSNAFYALNLRNKEEESFQPALSLSTRLTEAEMVEIRIRDNARGIPEEIQQKIFQQFFTTKARGTGTGLGLWLTYDIITVKHGGTLQLESEEGKFTEFILQIPLKKAN